MKVLGQTISAERARYVAKVTAFWLVAYAFLVGLAYFFPLRASDWYIHFAPRFGLYDYPPWLAVLLWFLPALPFLSGLTLTALLFVLWRRGARPVQVLAAFTALPVFWVLGLGQVDAVPMLGLAFLPWGLPLVMLKPQVGIWYAWAWWRQRPDKWRIVAGVAVFVLLTLAIWGAWPLRWHPPETAGSIRNISLWNSFWPLAVVALIGAVVERDPDRAMALGALAVPYVQGAGYLLLLPALSRLRGWTLGLVWATSWVAVLSLFWGERAIPLEALFPAALWAALAWQAWRARHPKVNHAA